MKILLAEAQAETRSALRLLLEEVEEVHIVGEAALASVLLAEVEVTKPDTVLLDWGLPGLRGTELVPALRARYPFVRVIALSPRPEARPEALKAGADEFASKGDPPEQLLRALQLDGTKPART